MKARRIALILGITWFCTGCSIPISFYLKNYSDQEVILEIFSKLPAEVYISHLRSTPKVDLKLKHDSFESFDGFSSCEVLKENIVSCYVPPGSTIFLAEMRVGELPIDSVVLRQGKTTLTFAEYDQRWKHKRRASWMEYH